VQTLRHAFLELQRTLPSVPPDTKLSKLDVLLLATTYIAHLTRSLQDEAEAQADPGLGTLRGDGYLHPVKVGRPGALRGWMGSRAGHLEPTSCVHATCEQGGEQMQNAIRARGHWCQETAA
jgi:hypothetical protein